jgi:predicted transcriptional regulator
MQNLQSQFTADTNTNTLANRQAATTPSIETQLETTSRQVPPSHTNSNVGTLLAIRARDIMESNVVCVSGEETISTVLDRMLAKDNHYAIVNGAEQTEGLVSRGELTGPICEYLKPFIAKWQRPGADATFNVAVKWVMSRQINTIAPDATCTAIMKKMRALNMSPLLVVEGGKAIGLVTPFNVFKIRALLKLEGDNTTTTNRQLIQALPARISSYMSGLNSTSHANLHVVE